MPPRRRRPPVRQATVTPSKVHRISGLQQWHNMLQKAGGRVVLVQFFQAGAIISSNFRQGFTHLSKSSRFKKVVFAEVELAESPEVAEEAGVDRAPTYQCYYNAELVSTYTGPLFPKVQEMLEAALKEYGGGGGLLTKLLTALAVVGVAAVGAYTATRLGRGEEGNGGGTGGEGLQDIERKLTTARQRLRMCERHNRIKGALAQRKLISRLEARKRVLERSLGKQPSSDKSGAPEAASSWFADFEDDSKLAQRRGPAAVVYTSEEE